MQPAILHDIDLDLDRYSSHNEQIEYRWVVTEKAPAINPTWDFSQIDQIFGFDKGGKEEYLSGSGIVEDMGTIIGKRKDGLFFLYRNSHFYSMTYSSMVDITVWYATRWHNLYWYSLDDAQRKAVTLVFDKHRFPTDTTVIT